MDKASDGQAVFWLLIQNTVSAGDERAGFIYLAIAAPEKRMDRALGHLLRYTEQVKRELWFAAHGVNVRQGVGGRNLAKQKRIVRNGWKKVHGLHQRKLVRQPVNRGVIAFVKAHQQIRIAVDLYAVEQLCQNTGADLGAAALRNE